MGFYNKVTQLCNETRRVKKDFYHQLNYNSALFPPSALRVTVIVLENGIDDPSSNPERGCLRPLCVYAIEKGMNPFLLTKMNWKRRIYMLWRNG